MKGWLRGILAAGGVLLLLAGMFVGYAWTREPLSAGAVDLGTNGAPRVHAKRVRYAPGGEVYVTLLIANRGRLPVEVVGLVAEDPNTPTGYYAAEIRVASDDVVAAVPAQPFLPVTLGGGASTRVVIVYRAAPCDALPERATGNAFGTFLSVSVRIRILGVLPKTVALEPGRMFSVPQPSRADC